MDRITSFLNNLIELYNSENKKIADETSKKMSKLKQLKKSASSIIDYSDEEILSIVNLLNDEGEKLGEESIKDALENPNFDLKDSNKKLLFDLLQIKYVVSFEFELEKKQLDLLDSIIKRVSVALEKELITSKKDDKNYEEAKELLSKINNKSGLINEFDFIEKNIISTDIEEKEKRDMLLEIFDFNKARYELLTGSLRQHKEREKLDKDEVEKILNKYGYSLENLKVSGDDQFIIDALLQEGKLDNIDAVLNKMSQVYPDTPFDFSKDDVNMVKKTFISILCKSDVETIDYALGVADKYGLSPDHLIKIPSVFVSQGDGKKRKKGVISTPESETIFVSGRSFDLEDNLDFLAAKGYDMERLKSKGLTLLTKPNYLLKYNYEIMKLYGAPFILENDISLNKAYTSLGGTNIATVYDRFLEMGEVGFDYIHSTMSKLLSDIPNHAYYYELKDRCRNNPDFSKKDISSLNTIFKKRENLTREELDEKYRVVRSELSSKLDEFVEEKTIERKKQSILGNLNPEKANQIYDYDILEDKNVKELDERFRIQNPYIYNIDGINISRNKFLRVFTIMKDVNDVDLKSKLLYSLTYNSLLSEEEFKTVEKNVNNLFKTLGGI